MWFQTVSRSTWSSWMLRNLFMVSRASTCTHLGCTLFNHSGLFILVFPALLKKVSVGHSSQNCDLLLSGCLSASFTVISCFIQQPWIYAVFLSGCCLQSSCWKKNPCLCVSTQKGKLSQFYQWAQCFDDMNCIAKKVPIAKCLEVELIHFFYLQCGSLDSFDTCVITSPSWLWPCTVTLLLSIHYHHWVWCRFYRTLCTVLLLLRTSLPLFVEPSPVAPTICCEVTFSQVMSSLVVVFIATCHCDTNRHCS